jgi:dTDP-4-amino-4,6-dideoxygalactose transaminase
LRTFKVLPVTRPKLPSAERLAPYLAAIDEARFYSNFGPQTRAFEERLCSHFGLETETTTTVANGTLGLTLALAAQDAPAGTLCLMPAWTFVASAHAAVLADLVPYFVDIDPRTWALDPQTIEAEIARAPAAVGAVMVVAPFGQPIDYMAWDDFKTRTGFPIVVDAAAAFDTLNVGKIPAVVSLHATKILGVGEGGFIASRDVAIIRNIRQRSNFGFRGARSAESSALNAKLSEYHAVIGLAALDMWNESRAAWMSVANAYCRALVKSNCVTLQPGFGDSWVSSTCVVSISPTVQAKAQDVLASLGIETRLWWGHGAHNHPATSAFPRTSLPVTENLTRSTIGLPFYQDLSARQVEHVVETLFAVASDV